MDLPAPAGAPAADPPTQEPLAPEASAAKGGITGDATEDVFPRGAGAGTSPSAGNRAEDKGQAPAAKYHVPAPPGTRRLHDFMLGAHKRSRAGDVQEELAMLRRRQFKYLTSTKQAVPASLRRQITRMNTEAAEAEARRNQETPGVDWCFHIQNTLRAGNDKELEEAMWEQFYDRGLGNGEKEVAARQVAPPARRDLELIHAFRVNSNDDHYPKAVVRPDLHTLEKSLEQRSVATELTPSTTA